MGPCCIIEMFGPVCVCMSVKMMMIIFFSRKRIFRIAEKNLKVMREFYIASAFTIISRVKAHNGFDDRFQSDDDRGLCTRRVEFRSKEHLRSFTRSVYRRIINDMVLKRNFRLINVHGDANLRNKV